MHIPLLSRSHTTSRSYNFNLAFILILGTLGHHVFSSALPHVKRERVPDDILRVQNVIDWMKEVQIPPKDVFVFYSGDAGQTMAINFCKSNPGYYYFWDIFDDKFSEAFGGANVRGTYEYTKSCSIAMARYAQGETRVFNHYGAASESFWLLWELPVLKYYNADYIYTMRDGTLDPNDHTGDLTEEPDFKAFTSYLQCHGVSGDVYVENDAALSAIADFCGQSQSNKEYNDGTPNAMIISLTNFIDDSQPMTAAPACQDTLTRLLSDCDGNDPVNNPNDFKFGFNYTTSDGWEFVLTPETTRAPANDADACNISYKFFFDSFEIRGKNFDANTLGVKGANLETQVGGCGKITKWKFGWTPNDPTYQWFASGQLPIGTKACVGRAVVSAGGVTAGDCTGSG